MAEQTMKKWLNDNELSLTILKNKYLKDNETFEHFIDRISNKDEELKELILSKKFIFGGRILSNRGIEGRKYSLSNCYVIQPPDDTIESIFDCCRQLARTYSYGGGCGIDLSNLRPNGAKVNNASNYSSGPVSFMDLFSQVTQTISQCGRRGALMISLDVNHPDIEEFIDCKTDLDRVCFANISVRINNKFMQCVESNSDYVLKFPTDAPEVDSSNMEYDKLYHIDNCYYKKVNAKKLFTKLAKNNWDYAEPGILYWDTITNYNMLSQHKNFSYAGVNPCAEEPLPAYGACLLGSINLSEFIINPFTTKAEIDFNSLEKATKKAIDALNEVLLEGMPKHPLKQQTECTSKWHQIGLGTLGLADCLIKLGVRYGSPESLQIIEKIYKAMAQYSVLQSLQWAKEKGKFSECNNEDLANSSFIQALDLPTSTIEEIKKYGLFNSQLLTCAPTGSIGTMLQCSTGVEPQFALSYTRKTKSLNTKDTDYKVYAQIVNDYLKVHPNADKDNLPDYFVTSESIAPKERVMVQSMLQKYIDASISSTVNLPKEATVEQVYDIYMDAWKNNLKGITIFRSGGKREGILVTEENKTFNTVVPKRPKNLPAVFHSVKVKGEQFIVLVGLYEDKPYEIFAFKPNVSLNLQEHKGVITKNSKMHYSFKSDLLEIKELESINEDIEKKAATLYSSMLLRHGVPIKYIVKTSKKVNDNITSFSSAMCRVLSKYDTDTTSTEKCPECGELLVNEGGCSHCTSCGYSKCS